MLHIRLSGIYLEHNNLAAAEEHLALGTELGKWSGRFDSIRNAAPTLVRLRLVLRDYDGALAAIHEADSAIDVLLSPQSKAELFLLKAKILVRRAASGEANQCVEEAAKLIGRDRGQAGDALALAAARVACAQARPEKALITLSQALESTEAAGRWGVALELRILRSLVRERLGDSRGAGADLERALAIGQPEGYQRIFIDEGEPMQLLLVKWLAHPGVNPLRAYASQLLAQITSELTAAAVEPALDSPNNNLAEPLSQRELEVLHLMALGKSNPEIARQLYLAPGTIKAHAAAIYRKLDVANRTEAVAHARELGILA
ncbi:MAG: LuxR C-terminal-related transcriptional regulator [Anaerolineae bacterium]